jgi:hypothetical protein
LGEYACVVVVIPYVVVMSADTIVVLVGEVGLAERFAGDVFWFPLNWLACGLAVDLDVEMEFVGVF